MDITTLAELRQRYAAPQARALKKQIGQMIGMQTGLLIEPETQEALERRYAPDL